MTPISVRPPSRNGTGPRSDPARGAARAPAHSDNDLTPAEQGQIDDQRQTFNFAAAERAELLREINLFQDMAAAQRKHDDDYLKELIRMI